MQPLATEDIHRPDSKTNPQTCLCWITPPAAATFGPISEWKVPSGIAEFAGVCWASHHGSGQSRQQTQARGLRPQAGRAGSRQGRARGAGAELRHRRTN